MHDDSCELTPQLEDRAVDHVKTVRCSNCGREAEIPREQPWIITGQEQYAQQLVSFVCPHCEHDITV